MTIYQTAAEKLSLADKRSKAAVALLDSSFAQVPVIGISHKRSAGHQIAHILLGTETISDTSDMLKAVKSIRNENAKRMDESAALLNEVEKRADDLEQASLFVAGKGGEISRDLPEAVAVALMTVKQARDVSGSNVAPTVEANLNSTAKYLREQVKHLRDVNNLRANTLVIGTAAQSAKLAEKCLELLPEDQHGRLEVYVRRQKMINKRAKASHAFFKGKVNND